MIIDIHTHIFLPAVRGNRENFFKGEEAFKTLYNSAQSKLVGANDLIAPWTKRAFKNRLCSGFPGRTPNISS